MTKHGNRARAEGAENGLAKFKIRTPVITACLVVIALCIGGYTFSYLKAVLSPLLIALFIFFLTNPIVRALQARKYSQTFAYFIVVMMTIFAFLGLGRAFYGSVQDVAGNIPKYKTNVTNVISTITQPVMRAVESLRSLTGDDNKKPPPQEVGESANPATNSKTEPSPEPKPSEESPLTSNESDAKVDRLVSSLQKVLDDFSGAKPSDQKAPPKNEEQRLGEMLTGFFNEGATQFVNGLIGTSLEFLEIAVMTIFYLFFILIEAHKLPQRIKRGFAYESTQTLTEIGVNIQRSIEQYLRVKTGVSFGLGAVTGLLGLFFGLESWLLWAGFMLIANYVTYVGSLVALVPPIAIAFLQIEYDSPDASIIGPILMSLLMIANRFFWIDYVEIKLSGQQLNVSPVILLLSIGLFGALWGVIGMVLAVPLVTSVKIALSQFESTSHLASLLSEE
jgi:predicted PurR-regulated permease PerM